MQSMSGHCLLTDIPIQNEILEVKIIPAIPKFGNILDQLIRFGLKGAKYIYIFALQTKSILHQSEVYYISSYKVNMDQRLTILNFSHMGSHMYCCSTAASVKRARVINFGLSSSTSILNVCRQ